MAAQRAADWQLHGWGEGLRAAKGRTNRGKLYHSVIELQCPVDLNKRSCKNPKLLAMLL